MTRRALSIRPYHVTPDMRSQAVANTVWGFATLNWELGGATWDALEAAVVRVGPGRGGIENKHSTDAESPSPSPASVRAFTLKVSGKSCSDLGSSACSQ